MMADFTTKIVYNTGMKGSDLYCGNPMPEACCPKATPAFQHK